MIIELFGKRNDGGTSFHSAVNYIASLRDQIDPDTGEVIDRGMVTTFTSCHSPETAAIEMWGTSALSARIKDPVFAGVISWPPGEYPTDEQMHEAGLLHLKNQGMEGHQYVMSVHRDTDNAHIHFVANRVHPETGRVAGLNHSYMTAVRSAREIEIVQGWQHVEQGPFKVREHDGEKVVDYRHASAKERIAEREAKRGNKPDQARKMEAFSGRESLASYVQGEPKKDALAALDKGGDWQALHKALAVHGLAIKPKGPGFAIHSTRDPAAVPVKASTMAQALGGSRLKSKLGEYREPTPEVARTEPRREYMKERPKRDPKMREEQREARAFERAKLRSRYDGYRTEWNAAKAPARAELYERQRRERSELAATLAAKAKAQRVQIKSSDLPGPKKRALYSLAAMQAATERAALAERIKAERAAFRAERPQDYRSWVADRAQEGDPAAIRQVRGWAYQDGRKARQMEREDAARGPGVAVPDDRQRDPAPPRALTDRVSWRVDRESGAVDYQLDGREAFRDTGRRIAYNDDSQRDDDAIGVGLLLAREKFGGQALNITGPDEFRQRVLAVAIERGLDVKFSDPELERRRIEGLRERQEARQRPDWTKHRGTFASDGGSSQRPPEAAQEPSARKMTAEEAAAALARPEPRLPNRELVELDAITAHGEAYRRQLEREFHDKYGERPDPAKAAGFVSRFIVKASAEQWDRDRARALAEIDEKVQERVAHMKTDAPDARKFRQQEWEKKENDHLRDHEAWSRDRWTAIQTTQEASMATPEQQPDDARARRAAEARALAEKQKQQAAEREQQHERGRDDPEIDR